MYFFILQTFVQYLIQSGGFFVDKTKGEISDKYQVPGIQDAVLDKVYANFFGLTEKEKSYCVHNEFEKPIMHSNGGMMES